jgi:hypothetical protein
MSTNSVEEVNCFIEPDNIWMLNPAALLIVGVDPYLTRIYIEDLLRFNILYRNRSPLSQF